MVGRACDQLLVGVAQKPRLFLQGSVQHRHRKKAATAKPQWIQSRPQAWIGKEANPTGHCLCLWCTFSPSVQVSLSPSPQPFPIPAKESLLPSVSVDQLETHQLQWPLFASLFLLLREHEMQVGPAYTWLIHQTGAVTWWPGSLSQGLDHRKSCDPGWTKKLFSSGEFLIKGWPQRLAYKRSFINVLGYSHGCSLKLKLKGGHFYLSLSKQANINLHQHETKWQSFSCYDSSWVKSIPLPWIFCHVWFFLVFNAGLIILLRGNS